MRQVAQGLLGAVLTFGLSGCGAVVPEIQEFWGAPDSASDRVAKITSQVKCELGNAVRDAIGTDEYFAKINHQGKRLDFMRSWIAEVVLILVVDEKTAVNPNVAIISPMSQMQSFTLGLGGGLSTEATRTDKVHFFYPVADFLKGFHYDINNPPPPCTISQPGGTLFLSSDLKIGGWLSREIISQYTRDATPYASVPGKSLAAAFSYDIKFEIVTSGTINPSWKLVHVSNNTGSPPLFGASRDRQQELIITIGPADGSSPTKTNDVAKNSSFSSELSSEIAAKTELSLGLR